MAREGAMLGIRSMYLGERDMPANNMLIKEGFLEKSDIGSFKEKFNSIINDKNLEGEQISYRNELNENWIDVTSLIISVINKY